MKTRGSLAVVITACCLLSVSCVPEAEVRKTSVKMPEVKTRAAIPGETPYRVEFIKGIGKVGTGVGEFFKPTAVDTDFDNNVYVLDSGTERVQVFSNEGVFIHEFDVSDTSRQQKPELVDIVIDKSFRIFISDRQNNTVAVYEIIGKMSEGAAIKNINYAGTLESKGSEKELNEVEIGNMFTFASGSPGGFYEVKEKEDDSVSVEETETLESMDFDFAEYGIQKVYIKVRFDHPMGLATDKVGNVFVVDSYSESVIKFNYFNDYEFSFGSFGRGINQFNNPRDAAVDFDQNIYVVDMGNNRIEKFDLNGNYLDEWGKKGSENGQFNNPVSIDLDKHGNIYIADLENSRVQVFNPFGEYLFQFGGKYPGSEESFKPLSLSVSDEGILYVLDSNISILSMFEIKYQE